MNRRRERFAKPRLDWRDPDLPIFTRILEEGAFGLLEKRAVVLTPDEMQATAQESMRYSQNPTFDRDPSYNWNRRNRKR